MNAQNFQSDDLEQQPSSPRISKNVLILGIVSFFNDIASEMIYPLVPIFLTTILGTPVSIVGLIEGIAEAIGSGFKLFAGLISDKLQKRKPFVVIGYSLSAISKIILGLAFTWVLVLIARFSDKLGKAIRTAARDSLITESSDETKRGTSFGFHRALDTLGAVFGPLLAIFFLKSLHENYNSIFLFAAIPGIIGIVLLVLFVKEKKKAPLNINLTISLLKISKFNKAYKIFVIASCLFALGNSSDAFLILRAKNLGMSLTLTILSYVAFNITYALLSTPAGIISDRISAKKVLLISFILFAVVYFLFGFVNHSIYIWILFPLYGLYMALSEGIGKAYISNLVATENSGTAFGIYQTAISICTLFASIIAGLLWSYVSVPAPFIYGSIMAILAGLIFWIL